MNGICPVDNITGVVADRIDADGCHAAIVENPFSRLWVQGRGKVRPFLRTLMNRYY
jgi:hypothetical protein